VEGKKRRGKRDLYVRGKASVIEAKLVCAEESLGALRGRSLKGEMRLGSRLFYLRHGKKPRLDM
jgi:hypothetical protein